LKIWFSSSHSAARRSAGSSAGVPESSSAFAASAVSQVGETQGWKKSASPSSMTKSSIAWMPFATAGCSSA
jgi:hypothetical protein